MRGESAGGHDGIQIKTLKKIKSFIIKPLAYIYNLCLRQGIYPSNFKVAIVKPVYKKGDKNLVENFRPISLTTAFSKIFERIIKVRLVKFLDENKILSESQYGFREGRSTNDAIVEVIEYAYEAMDKGQMAAILFLDLSKCFDRVSHQVLISILQEIGFEKHTLGLFSSYLTNRTQMVKIGTTLSDELVNSHYSTPQGTVLSPVLYNVYVHKMYDMRLGGRLVSYADDTALCVRGDTWTEVFQHIQNDMKKINLWFEEHNLKINIDKTKILPLCITKTTLPRQCGVQIHVDNCDQTTCQCGSIGLVHSWTYLGVEIDQHLSYMAIGTNILFMV
ncbi:hypothetical protein M8J77_009381 [Diaphorina citri]|nr:hypothetical protein M8J77_009381 [Diaphorina citri]